ncbi:MAG TPA: hypothetical protein VMU51_17550 [Mycobacteriales bacterium]|nr:hypothetical protein [Mycobacteriales bacterium]
MWAFVKRQIRTWVGRLSIRGKLYLIAALIVLAGMLVSLYNQRGR